MVSALSITLNMPNIGLIIYYLVCIILIPIILINSKDKNMISLYLPLLLPIAQILKTSGNPNMYQNLLMDGETKNMVAFVSNTIILILTVIGILWYSIGLTMRNNRLEDGIVIGLVISIVVFGSTYVLLPEAIKNLDHIMRTKTQINLNYNWHRYVAGFIVLLIIVGLQLSVFSLYKNTKSLREQVQF
tara:strand:+ start:508 stop:1071 length:564 start_codon:yes stop_codon:yes gene_type:complete